MTEARKDPDTVTEARMDGVNEDDTIQRLREWGVDDCEDPDVESSEEEDTDRSRSKGARRAAYTNGFKVSLYMAVCMGVILTQVDWKLAVIEAVKAGARPASVAVEFGIVTPSSVYAWLKNETAIRQACENLKRSKVCIGGQGRPCSFPYDDAVVQWIKQMRRDDFPLKTSHVMTFVKEEYSEWVCEYLSICKEASLYKMMQRLIRSRGFSFRKPSRTVLSTVDLEREQREFASSVGAAVRQVYSRECIWNVDETAVYFDEEPGLIITESGSKKSARVMGLKRSQRASVLLAISAAGGMLMPLIIFQGERGGQVEEEMHPDGVYVTVQKNAWMDGNVWQDSVISGVWGDFVSSQYPDALALYVDNLKCHTSDRSIEGFADWGTEVVPLPKNTTAVLQPLDVGIMGPFKKKLRAFALQDDIAGFREAEVPLRDHLIALKKRPAWVKRQLVVTRVLKAWKGISAETIRRAWEKSGL